MMISEEKIGESIERIRGKFMVQKERPILFSGPMVKAILEGRKTQTRRVIRLLPNWKNAGLTHSDLSKAGWWKSSDGWQYGDELVRCPYGEPSDRLWVRETFWCTNDSDSDDYSSWDCGSTLSLGEKYSELDYCATPEYLNPPKLEGEQTFHPHSNAEPGDWWLAPPEKWDETDDDRVKRGEWIFQPWPYFTKHPSIHMPRWASRITLEITDVRVERLKDISIGDAIAEGIRREKNLNGDYGWMPAHEGNWELSNFPRNAFAASWDSINEKRGFGWEKNPWVWVVEFKRVEGRSGR